MCGKYILKILFKLKFKIKNNQYKKNKLILI